nr:MAG TPA: hypothetical protein [Caudoviricetes sp.]
MPKRKTKKIQNKIVECLQWLDRINYRACKESRDIIYDFVECHFVDENDNLKLDNAKGYEYQIALYIHLKTQPPCKIITVRLYNENDRI